MSDSNSHKAASPAKGRGRGRGRGRGTTGASRGTSKKAAVVAATNGRGVNPAAHKTTAEAVADGSFTRAQAAEERSKELRASFIAVSNAIKPALEELAERNVNLLRDSFDAHEEVAAFKEIRKFLQNRYDDTEKTLKRREQAGLNQCSRNLQLQTQLTNLNYQRQYDEATEDFYDTQLRRLDILEEFCRRKVPTDLEDRVYLKTPVSKDRIDWTKAHVEFENGVEVPCAKVIKAQHVLDFETSRREMPEDMLRPTFVGVKRKAEAALLDQVPPKRPASAMDGDRPAYIPRHIGGLLSATNPDDEETPSRAPSPLGSKLPSPSPESTSKSSPDGDRPYVPPASSDPDEHGVRLISKRRPVTTENYNRLMLPPLYEYEDHEIGFRDSFNDRSRYKSTRIPQFFNKPNSFAFFVDRMISSVDVGTYEPGDLSEELIEKHALHPKYGLFLKTSKNEAEPPAPVVSGDHPIVLIDRTGRIQHASRSIVTKYLDQHTREREVKLALSEALNTMRQEHQLDRRLLTPEPADKEARRQELIHDREVPTPQSSRSPSPALSQHGEGYLDEDAMAMDEEDKPPSAESSEHPSQQWLELIDAVAVANEEETRATAAAQPRRTPFDPVRDLLDSPAPPPEPSNIVDTAKLDAFAQIALSNTNEKLLYAAEAPSSETSPYPKMSQPNSFQELGLPPTSSIERTSSQLSNRPSSRTSYPPPQPSASQSVVDSTLTQPDARRISQSPSVPPQPSGDASMLDPRLFGESDTQAQSSVAPREPSSQNRHFLYTALNPEPEYGTTPSALASDGRLPPIPSEHSRALDAELPPRYTGTTFSNHPPGPHRDNSRTPSLHHIGNYGPRQELTEVYTVDTAGASSHPSEAHSMRPNSAAYHTPPTARPYYENNYESHAGRASPAHHGATSQYVHAFVHDDRMSEQQQQQPHSQHHGGTPFTAPLGSHLPPPPLQPIHHHHNQYAQHPSQPGHYQMQSAYHGPHQYPPSGMPPQIQHTTTQYHTMPLQMEAAPSPGDMNPRQLRSSSNGSTSAATNGTGNNNNPKYRKLEPAPLPPHRQGSQSGPELRTVPFNYREGIKDYTASEPPPRHGPTQIRGWTYNNLKKPRVPKESRASKD
ncbi:hypothetical protein MCOR27_011398 [Pyricularia oryzae]|uniref:Uncharacterized protein n=1 Tax=Pyricularia grisea TaxID=148305 RepID=A0ABQ8NBC0_PYRGI|nr:hypothetical protein MCOR01_008312 [Pyricularia oryzae]KAI6294341.1 hypothetical protein MCOR33_008496 [Pyricularia grisea]KAI6252196.1 hypothetical protein MCOR19_011186 [Pyricularia oryzae]KAI6265446.1 hypothetical protein MCOR27_011398 [Pyricularia oryzae]KAI6295087.1 hypothetical protein MCOR34_009638 [Pyricularia oryzae]